MPLPELSESTMRMLARRYLEPLDARIYLLTLYGDPSRGIPPPTTRQARAKLIGKRECVVNARFIIAEQLMIRVCREYQETHEPDVVVVRQDTPEESGLYFGDTLAYGHHCDTRIDHVEETVVLGRPIEEE